MPHLGSPIIKMGLFNILCAKMGSQVVRRRRQKRVKASTVAFVGFLMEREGRAG